MKSHTYRETLRQHLLARPSRLLGHLKKHQVALCEVRFMMREKHQNAPSPRDRVLARPEQRAMLKDPHPQRQHPHNKGRKGNFTYLRVVKDEIREQYKVELIGARGLEERLDSTAPYVPKHSNMRITIGAHDVLRDVLRHIIHERAVRVIRQHDLLHHSNQIQIKKKKETEEKQKEVERAKVVQASSLEAGAHAPMKIRTKKDAYARSARRSWRRRALAGLRPRRARVR
jgi:hypothetical protein